MSEKIISPNHTVNSPTCEKSFFYVPICVFCLQMEKKTYSYITHRHEHTQTKHVYQQNARGTYKR